MASRSGTGGTGRVPTGERFPLGVVAARPLGIVFTVSALLNLLVPEPTRLMTALPTVIALLAMLGGFALVGTRGTLLGIGVAYCGGLAAMGALLLTGHGDDLPSALATVTTVSSLAITSLIPAVVALRGPRLSRWPGLTALGVGAGIPVAVLAALATAATGRAVFVVLAIIAGWAALTLAGLWLLRSARKTDDGLSRLRQGYAAERAATEAEANLRYGARVMHDTVLSTLGVIAHEGSGVAPELLRSQAAADRGLLERLRTRGVVAERAPGPTDAHPSADGRADAGGHPGGHLGGDPDGDGDAPRAPGHAFRSAIDAWAGFRGITITWYGDDRIRSTAPAAEALRGAVSECLENVRRHSGRTDAEVTVSHQPDSVRAVVTDTGVGFDREAVPAGRLGLAESVEMRVRSVGGSARVFSSPGRGTTVLLEVPR